jgi:hypothetical protein
MRITKGQLRRIIKEQVGTDRLAQAIGMLEGIMEELTYDGADAAPSKRDPFRHKKVGAYGGAAAVRSAEEAERNAQKTYDELVPLMNVLLSMQGKG